MTEVEDIRNIEEYKPLLKKLKLSAFGAATLANGALTALAVDNAVSGRHGTAAILGLSDVLMGYFSYRAGRTVYRSMI